MFFQKKLQCQTLILTIIINHFNLFKKIQLQIQKELIDSSESFSSYQIKKSIEFYEKTPFPQEAPYGDLEFIYSNINNKKSPKNQTNL